MNTIQYYKDRTPLKLTAGLLVFLFILTPIAPILAAGAATPPPPPSYVDNAAEALPSTPDDTSDDTPPPTDLKSTLPTNKVSGSYTTGGTQMQTMDITSTGADVTPAVNPIGINKQTISPEIDKNTGALNYEYPITLPPGRNGLTPDLSLKYNSQRMDNSSIIGTGWELSIPYIVRKNTHGIDQLYQRNDFISSTEGDLQLSDSKDSVQTYVPQSQNPDFSQYSLDTSTNIWKLTTKTGTVLTFGDSTSSREDDPPNPAHIFKWMLSSVTDTNGNTITYTYTKDLNRLYPSNIHYAVFDIGFTTEARTDTSALFVAGFSQGSTMRINKIVTTISGITDKTFTIIYNSPSDSKITAISDGILTTTFSYQTTVPNWTYDSTWKLPNDQSSPNTTYSGQPLQISIDPSYHSGFVTTSDVNGDGLPDFIYSYDFNERTDQWCAAQPNCAPLGQQPNYVYINNGHGWTYDSTWKLPVDQTYAASATYGGQPVQIVLDPSRTHVAISDVNGDGLPDFIYSYENIYSSDQRCGSGPWQSSCAKQPNYVYINNGHGWTYDPTWQLPVDQNALSTTYGSQPAQIVIDPSRTNVATTDVNGDGLPDFIYSYYSYTNDQWCASSQCGPRGQQPNYVYINNGHGWTYDSSWKLPNDQSAPNTTYSGQPLQISIDPSRTNVATTDVNGDGLPDFIYSYYSYTNDQWCASSQCGPRGQQPNYIYISNNNKYVLKSVILPTGGKVDVTYKPSTQYKDINNNSLNPKLPFIVQTVNSISTSDSINNVSIKNTYIYSDGSYFINPTNVFDRKFTGFGLVTSTDSVGNVTKTYYHQGNTTNDAFGEYDDQISKAGKVYSVEEYDNAGHLYRLTVDKWDRFNIGTNHDFIKLARETVLTYDGDDTHKDTATEYIYDNANGNLLTKTEYGQVTANNDGSYTDTGSDTRISTYTCAVNSTNGVNVLSSVLVTDGSSNKVAEQKFYYDTLSYGSVDKGNQTKVEQWVAGSKYVNTQKTYTSYGSVETSIDPRGKVTSYIYDNYNLYPATVINALNQPTQFTYDYSSGQVIQKTDPNNRVFQNTYDGLGRLLEEKQPDLSSPSSLVTGTAYIYTDTPNEVSVHKTENLDGATARETYQYFDGLGRLIQQRVEAEDSNFEVIDKTYNTRGLLEKESLPYFSEGASKTAPTTSSYLYTTYTYDAMGRVITSENNLGNTANTYSDWKFTVTDANDKSKDLYKDAYGNLAQVDEHNEGNTYSTNYAYDYLGNLTKITDALGNIRNFTYDGLGRRMTAEDLHTDGDTTFGAWTYVYDDAGNLIQVVDPNGSASSPPTAINYIYDDTNRQLTEDFAGLSGVEVTNTYDEGADGIGHLTSIATPTLTQTNSYNPLGGIKSESKVIKGATYVTGYDYDRQENQVLITNPDSSVVKNTYNSAGLLDSTARKESADSDFVDVISSYDYSPTEQPTTINYENGATTENTYDARKLYRLTAKVTTIAAGSHSQDLAYTYDTVGNIRQIVDASATDTAKTATYIYDDLYRLTSATISNVPAGQSAYTHTFTYNAIGNILTRTETVGTNPAKTYTYFYDGNLGDNHANPHAVTSVTVPSGVEGQVTTTSYTYDKNGNVLTVGAGQTNTWDYNNRLIKAVAGDNTDVYTYDASGQRISSTNTKRITLPTLSSVHIESNNAERSAAKVKDTVTLTFSSSTNLEIPTVTIAGHPAAVSGTGSSSGSGPYTATYVMTSADSAGTVAFTIDFKNTSHNSGIQVSTTTDSSGVDFDNTVIPPGSDPVIIPPIVPPGTTLEPVIRSELRKPPATSSSGGVVIPATIREPGVSSESTTVIPSRRPSIKNRPPATSSIDPLAPVTSTSETPTPEPTETPATEPAPTHVPEPVVSPEATPETPSPEPTVTPPPASEILPPAPKRLEPIRRTIRPEIPASRIDLPIYPSSPSDSLQSTTTSVLENGFKQVFAFIFGATAYADETPVDCTLPEALNTTTNECGIPAPLDSGNVIPDNSILESPPATDSGTQVPSSSISNGDDDSIIIAPPASEETSISEDTKDVTVTTVYPSKFYNTDGTTATKHIFSNGSESGTITGTGSLAVVRYTHTDQLTGSNIVTNVSGTIDETLDYFPFGGIRIDSGSYSDQRKYIGQEYDEDTGLSYLNARYYDSARGQFISEDPMFWNFDKSWLVDPQNQNSYSYARNNPINLSDPSGRSTLEAMGGWAVGFASRPFAIAQSIYNASAQYSDRGPLGGLLMLRDAAAGIVNTVGTGAKEAYSLATDFKGTTSQYGQAFNSFLDNTNDFEKGKAVGGMTFDAELYASSSFSVLKTAQPSSFGTLSPKIIRQMEQRGWTQEQIKEAIKSGQQVPAVNKATGNPSTRYISPSTGQSVVVDSKTGEVIHVGGSNFKYGSSSGDVKK